MTMSVTRRGSCQMIVYHNDERSPAYCLTLSPKPQDVGAARGDFEKRLWDFQ